MIFARRKGLNLNTVVSDALRRYLDRETGWRSGLHSSFLTFSASVSVRTLAVSSA